MTTLSFCEPVWASPTSRVHIRALTGEPKFGGGIEESPLCGSDLAYGWDLLGDVTTSAIRRRLGAETGPVCPDCAEQALRMLG